MEIEIAKKLLKTYLPEHGKFIKKSEVAERYYRNETDILIKGATVKHECDDPLRNADNRIPSNFHGLLVNQKAAYLFTEPPIFDIGANGNDEKDKKLQEILGDRFPKYCKDLCINASNSSVAWAHVWMDDESKVQYAAIDPKQIVPIWTNDLNRQLQAVIRSYAELQDDGKLYEIIEIWTADECATYIKAASSTIRSIRPHNIFTLPDAEEPTNIYRHNFGFVPFIPFYNNGIKTNDLDNIKALIDCYDKVFSGFLNDLEDIQEVIFVLSGYSGTDLDDFLDSLKKYKTVKLDDVVDGSGGLSTITIDIPVEAREKMLAMTRKSIFEQGQGIDPDPQNFGNSSGVALGYLYSLLELKAGLMETEFRLSFAEFIRAIGKLSGIEIDKINQTWTRTRVANDAETADIATKSVGIISNKTILKKHPFVEDAEAEIKQMEEEKQKAQEEMTRDVYGGAFPPKQPDDQGGELDGPKEQ